MLVRSVRGEGQAIAAALEERAVPYRLSGAAAFFQRAEVRDLLAWLRLLVDPGDAGAVVRALARPPIELRAIDLARCTQIARRRKLDMVAALGAAMESPQIPPEARERIALFLKMYRSAAGALDSTRPDLYVHRLIERLGLRRQLLFAASTEVVERLVNLAKFGELAADYLRRSPQATAREFARAIAAVADAGLREEEAHRRRAPARRAGDDDARGQGARVRPRLRARRDGRADARPAPAHARADPGRADQGGAPARLQGRARRRDAAAAARRDDARAAAARDRLPGGDRARRDAAAVAVRRGGARRASAREWEQREEELFGPAETLQSTFRLLRDELLTTVQQVGGRLGELRFDTDLDVSHAVVRYLEVLKLSALMERTRDGGLTVAEALPGGQRAAAAGGDRRAARDLRDVGARRVPARRRARREAARAGGRAAHRAVAGAVPAAPRRRAGAVARATSRPTGPARSSTSSRACSGSRPSRRSTSASASSSTRCSSASTPAARRPARCPSCSGCSRPAGGAAGSATPRRSASCARRRRRRCCATTSASRTRTASRSGSSARSRSSSARTCCAGASTASTSCRTAATS